jgi:hypothetical protein
VPSPSKVKGNKNERDVAKTLSSWWGEEFKRTPNSGALRWKGASWTYGDILPPESFPAVVECKHYSDIDLDEVIRCAPTDSNILGWWRETTEDAQRCYEETNVPAQPILVYKQNRVPRRIVIEAEFLIALGGRKLGLPAFWVSSPEREPLAILDFKTFLASVSRDLFLRSVRKVIPTALVERIVA